MSLKEVCLKRRFGGKEDKVKPAAWEPRTALRKTWACPPLFLNTISTERKEEPSPIPACVSVVSGNVSSWISQLAQLSYYSSIIKAWKKDGEPLVTKSFNNFLCLISYTDLKYDPDTAFPPFQKPKIYSAGTFFSLPWDHGPWKI